MRKRAFTPTLPMEIRQKIIKYNRDNPDTKFTDIAAEYKCTAAQVRYTIKNKHKYKKKKEGRNNYNTKTIAAIKDDVKDGELDFYSMLQKETEFTLIQLHAGAEKIHVTERVSIIEKLTKISLMYHLRGVDMEVLRVYTHGFDPNLTDQQIVQRFAEAKEKVK